MFRTESQQGYILTRGSHDQLKSSQIELWAATDRGPALLRITDSRSTFFIDQSDAAGADAVLKQHALAAELKSLSLQTFRGNRVCGVYTSNIHSHYRAQDVLRDIGIDCFEGDIRLHERYLMERFIRAGTRFCGDVKHRQGYIEVNNARLKPDDYKPNLKALSLDIECDVTGELFSVGLSGCGCAEVHMIGKAQKSSDVEIRWFENEFALIAAVIGRINDLDPDVLIGWNLINFDLRILLMRAAHHNIRFTIGRDFRAPGWRDVKGEKDKGFIFIPGRVAIDGIDALKTATYRFDSFSLENVAQALLGRGKKIDDAAKDRAAEIKNNFLNDKLKLAAYNLTDCQLVEDIFDHANLLDFLVLRSQITGLEIDRTGGSVAAFSNLYLPRLHRGGYVAPNLSREGGLASPGGYVMDSLPGLYKNVLVLDFKSLYPSIICTFKIDPMGLIEGLKNPHASIEGFRGGKFDREKHFLPQIIRDLWRQRDIAKNQRDAARSRAIKILMNSFYGVLGTNGCRFYDPRLTSSITMRGHEIMQTTRGWIEKRGYRVIYGDTDSLFVWVGEDVPVDRCREIGRMLQEDINLGWQNKIRADFDLESFLELEFEIHFSRFLMPTVRGSEAGSKKRYAGLIQDGQGGELVFKGLENVRTDWTVLARSFQSRLYEMIFNDQDTTEFIRTTVEETLNGLRDDELVYTKQLRRPLGLYVKNVPPHVKAARLADEENRKRGRPLRYQHKGRISYVLTTSGPQPVEYRNAPIDYQLYVDKQLKPIADGILPFINRDFDSIVSAQAVIFAERPNGV